MKILIILFRALFYRFTIVSFNKPVLTQGKRIKKKS